MFDNFSNKITKIFDTISGKKFISEEDLNATMREIRIALLEADVSLSIAKEFIEKVKTEALGQQVIKSVSPGQMVVKIVHDELVKLLGGEKAEINLATTPPAIIMMVGLQGAGKTTYIEHEVEARKTLGHQILVLDPHREYGAWEGLEVVGDGMDYQAIDDELSNLGALIKSRYEQRATVKGFNPKPITVICEEFTKWSAKCSNSDDFFSAALSDCRKVRVHVVFVAHARTMGALTKKVGMSAMFENGSTKLEILGKLNALGKTVPSGFADLYNSRDGKATRVAIPDLSKKESIDSEIDDLFEDEIPNGKVIPINKKRTA